MSKLDINCYYGKYIRNVSFTDLYSGFYTVPLSLLTSLQSTDLNKYRRARVPFMMGSTKENQGWIHVKQYSDLKSSFEHITFAQCKVSMVYGVPDKISVEVEIDTTESQHKFVSQTIAPPFFQKEGDSDIVRCLCENGSDYISLCLSMTYYDDPPSSMKNILSLSQYNSDTAVISLRY